MNDEETLTAYRWRLAVIQNIGLLVCIALCTIAVAYFAKSAAGLWSMLIMLVWLGPGDANSCDCDEEYDDEEEAEEQPKAA